MLGLVVVIPAQRSIASSLSRESNYSVGTDPRIPFDHQAIAVAHSSQVIHLSITSMRYNTVLEYLYVCPSRL